MSAEGGQYRARAAAAEDERDSCKSQYAALFKEHQRAADAVESLKADKDRLQRQSAAVAAAAAADRSSTTKKAAGRQQIQQPRGSIRLGSSQRQASSPRPVLASRPAAIRNGVGHLEQPQGRGFASSTTARSAVIAPAAPVAAQPPPAAKVMAAQVVGQVEREDVMEAPVQDEEEEEEEEEGDEDLDEDEDVDQHPYHQHGIQQYRQLHPQQQQQQFQSYFHQPHQIQHSAGRYHQQGANAYAYAQQQQQQQQQHVFQQPPNVHFQRRAAAQQQDTFPDRYGMPQSAFGGYQDSAANVADYGVPAAPNRERFYNL